MAFVLFFFLVITLVGVLLLASWFIGAKARHGGAQDIPYESGIVPVGDAEDMRLSIEFYLVAMFFVIFDLETIFIVVWAVAFEEVGWVGYGAIAVFIGMLLVALLYELKTGALEWGVKSRRRGLPHYASMESESP